MIDRRELQVHKNMPTTQGLLTEVRQRIISVQNCVIIDHVGEAVNKIDNRQSIWWNLVLPYFASPGPPDDLSKPRNQSPKWDPDNIYSRYAL